MVVVDLAVGMVAAGLVEEGVVMAVEDSVVVTVVAGLAVVMVVVG